MSHWLDGVEERVFWPLMGLLGLLAVALALALGISLLLWVAFVASAEAWGALVS
jgi:hypothetical protein